MRRAAAVGVAVGVALAASWLVFQLVAAVDVRPPVELEVDPGESARQVATRLEREGVVRSARLLLLVARLQGLDRSFTHGIHEFAGPMTPAAVARELARLAPQATVAVTIPEGMSWHEVGELLEAEGVVPAAAYHEAACDPLLQRRVGVAEGANCLEGYLFPDTYALARDASAVDIVAVQLQRFSQILDHLLTEYAPQAGNALMASASRVEPPAEGPWRPWQPGQPGQPGQANGEALAALQHDAVVLASIIEKETSIPAERPLVSSVFHNRLRRGMRLQADPTVIYGLLAAGKPWDGNNLHRYLRMPGPYNTYTNGGLPPGPICNPGREALWAALNPADTSYLYFVATGDGAHDFSTTLAEHNRAVSRLRSR